MIQADFIPEKVKEYIDGGGSACPYCGTSGDMMETADDYEYIYIYRRWICQSCGKKWTEEYTLTNVYPSE